MSIRTTSVFAGFGFGLLVACSGEAPAGVAPEVAQELVGTQSQVATNGTTSATAYLPYDDTYGYMSFSASVSGSTGLAGACGLAIMPTVNGWATCPSSLEGAIPSTSTDCPAVPAGTPSGASRYCLQPDGQSQKYCFIRPGPASTFCVGSPATGQPTPPGTYSTAAIDWQSTHYDLWMTYSCVNGCSGGIIGGRTYLRQMVLNF